jgi:hypothetical protein
MTLARRCAQKIVYDGFGYREAMKKFGLTSVSSVQIAIEKIKNEKYEAKIKELEDALEARTERKNATLFLYDLHIPHNNQKNINMAIAYAKANYKIERIILGGDIVDCESISKFSRSGTVIDLRDEFDAGISFLATLRNEFKDAIIYYVKGNHEDRLVKYLWNKASELASLRGLTLQEQLQLDRFKVQWIDNIELKSTTGKFFRIGKLNILHGHELGICPIVNPAMRFLTKSMDNLIVGHIHSTDEKYLNTLDGKTIGCHCVGTLADLNPLYRPQNGWIAGFAIGVFDEEGFYSIKNKKILDGKIL